MKKEKVLISSNLWDEIMKVMAATMPEQFFPLFKEVFGKDYPKGTPIRLLSTEYSTYAEGKSKPPRSKLTDLTLLVNETDFYHIECQMKNDADMVIRMVSYDLHIALQHSTEQDEETGEIVIKFPRSAVIYPEKNQNLPKSLKCRIIFQDGSMHIYEVPTVRIQTYSMQEIREKHLILFIPYVLLRLRPKLKTKKGLTKNELTELMAEVKMIIEEEFAAGNLTENQKNDLIQLFRQSGERIFARHEEFWEEVTQMESWLLEEMPSVKLKRKDEEIERLQAENAEKDNALAEKDNAIAVKDAENAKQRAIIAELQRRLAVAGI